MRAPESLIPVLEQLCTVLEQLCRVEADKLTVVSADHPDQLESLLNDENMLLLQLRGLDKKRSDLLRRSGLEGLTFRQILMQEDSEEAVALLSPILERLSSQAEKLKKIKGGTDRLIRIRMKQLEQRLPVRSRAILMFMTNMSDKTVGTAGYLYFGGNNTLW